VNRLLAGLLLFILLICGLTSCQQPVGNLDSSSGGGGFAEDFWIFSLKTYYINDTSQNILYRRSDHVKIIGVGEPISINDNRLEIRIMTDPLFIGPSVDEIINPSEYFKFTMPGNYILKGSFNSMSDEHHFEVFGSPVETGEGSTSLGMTWLD